jgi:hypothetical protein
MFFSFERKLFKLSYAPEELKWGYCTRVGMCSLRRGNRTKPSKSVNAHRTNGPRMWVIWAAQTLHLDYQAPKILRRSSVWTPWLPVRHEEWIRNHPSCCTLFKNVSFQEPQICNPCDVMPCFDVCSAKGRFYPDQRVEECELSALTFAREIHWQKALLSSRWGPSTIQVGWLAAASLHEE